MWPVVRHLSSYLEDQSCWEVWPQPSCRRPKGRSYQRQSRTWRRSFWREPRSAWEDLRQQICNITIRVCSLFLLALLDIKKRKLMCNKTVRVHFERFEGQDKVGYYRIVNIGFNILLSASCYFCSSLSHIRCWFESRMPFITITQYKNMTRSILKMKQQNCDCNKQVRATVFDIQRIYSENLDKQEEDSL